MSTFDMDDTYEQALGHDEILRAIAHQAAFKTLAIMRVVLWIGIVVTAMLSGLHDGWLTLSVVLFVLVMASQLIYESQSSALSVQQAAHELMRRSRRAITLRQIIRRSVLDAIGSTLLGVLIRATSSPWTTSDLVIWGGLWFLIAIVTTMALRLHHSRRQT